MRWRKWESYVRVHISNGEMMDVNHRRHFSRRTARWSMLLQSANLDVAAYWNTLHPEEMIVGIEPKVRRV